MAKAEARCASALAVRKETRDNKIGDLPNLAVLLYSPRAARQGQQAQAHISPVLPDLTALSVEPFLPSEVEPLVEPELLPLVVSCL